MNIVFATSLVLWTIQSVEGKNCVCATVDLSARTEHSNYILPKGTCAEINQDLDGFDKSLWYLVEYNKQIGWIQKDDSKMTVSQCLVAPCEDRSSTCITRAGVCDQYKPWAFENCRKHCNLCDDTPCIDLVDCARYGKSLCSQSGNWVRKNCGKYCGFCGSDCHDRDTACSKYGGSACSVYPLWAKTMCQKHCQLCDQMVTTTVKPSTDSCKDMDGIDCVFLDSATGVCGDTTSAKSYCPKYCKICGSDIVGK